MIYSSNQDELICPTLLPSNHRSVHNVLCVNISNHSVILELFIYTVQYKRDYASMQNYERAPLLSSTYRLTPKSWYKTQFSRLCYCKPPSPTHCYHQS